ncbi:hypothetical protein JFV29_13100 [Peribacillus sp. TH16]|uniref:hypothetical protein n=1 Tax=Peribacillus sp. TH16 TaxID=2798482 RepID=UPI001911A53F|nr:hypothetical protein [Peribacillus sp. TH16]MBK5482815.1 hypothetical protein [Peribacillus sp. TH16]
MLATVEYNEFKKIVIFVIGFTPLKSKKIQKMKRKIIKKPVIISNGKPIPLDTNVFRQHYYIIISTEFKLFALLKYLSLRFNNVIKPY